MKKSVRILYFGTPEMSAKLLEKLIVEGYNVVGVVSQIDKPSGRKMKLEPTPTKIVASKYNIPLYQFEKIKENIDKIKEINPELILTFAYGQIMPIEILETPKYGSLNFHGSILPSYRGAAPIQYAILNGDKETGVSLMEMVQKMDAGRVFGIEKIEINDDNYTELSNKMVDAAYKVFIDNIDDYLSGKNKGVAQDESKVTFTKKILEEDEKLDFNEDAVKIHNKIRALSESPCAYFINNEIKYKIGKSILLKDVVDVPGKVISYDKKNFVIACNNGAIRVEKIQKQGKKMMNYADFYNGNREEFKVNDIIK